MFISGNESLESQLNVKEDPKSFSTDKFRSFGDRRNSFVPFFGGREDRDDLRVANIILGSTVNVISIIESKNFAFLRYMEVGKADKYSGRDN